MICGCSSYKPYADPEQTIPVASMGGTTTARVGPLNIEYQYKKNDPKSIPIILKIMKQQGVGDMNRDGKVNCIDYSITFRNLYGQYACLIINNNPHTNMNHMFVIVFCDSGIISIEPQGDPDWYTMGQVWGSRYDPYYNKDVTYIWGQYVGY